MKTKTLSLSSEQIQALRSQFKNYPIRTDLPHTLYQIKLDQGSIIAYKSGKVVFQGNDGLLAAKPYQVETKESVGSDEVGTGDYFGPMIVCAAYYHPDFDEFLNALAIVDSKQLNDEQILSLVPLFIDKVPHSLLILEPVKYNQVQTTHNLNKMKAQMHQKAFSNLKEKMGFLPELKIIDQFTPEAKYYQYLNETYGLEDFIFETKAESKHTAVALAAMMARYAFLKYFEAMNQQYHFNFPKGSSALVDQAGQRFVQQYGKEALKNVAKLHFKNTQRIIEV